MQSKVSLVTGYNLGPSVVYVPDLVSLNGILLLKMGHWILLILAENYFITQGFFSDILEAFSFWPLKYQVQDTQAKFDITRHSAIPSEILYKIFSTAVV